MKLVSVILMVLAIGLAAVGIAFILPGKKRKGGMPDPALLSPDSMVKVTPAGPGRLRMSIPQGDRMPMEVMLQVAEVKEDTDLDRLRNPATPPDEKQKIVNRLRAAGYEISYEPLPQGVNEPFEPVTTVAYEGEAPDDMTSE